MRNLQLLHNTLYNDDELQLKSKYNEYHLKLAQRLSPAASRKLNENTALNLSKLNEICTFFAFVLLQTFIKLYLYILNLNTSFHHCHAQL